MRAGIFGAFIVTSATAMAGAALAQSGGQMAVPPSPSNQTYDIPAGSKDQTIMITTRAFKPGESATPHIHHGVEMSEVLSGTVKLCIAGQAPKILHAGDSFLVPREAPHDAVNIGTDDVKLSVTFAIDKGTAPRTPVDASQVPCSK